MLWVRPDYQPKINHARCSSKVGFDLGFAPCRLGVGRRRASLNAAMRKNDDRYVAGKGKMT